MEIKDSRIDAGKPFDWGRTSKEYARFRDIYPEEFYRKIVGRNKHIIDGFQSAGEEKLFDRRFPAIITAPKAWPPRKLACGGGIGALDVQWTSV